ncbi:MAG TPA: DEAD/DEAH box helicase [Polyangiaceae bacterium]|jgi:superfamily II DNA or RNA helicase|nr:DEAD/DEAH box helicase [Polyangiaceae bacterium]
MTTARGTLDGQLRIDLASITLAQRKAIIQVCSHTNPAYRNAARRGDPRARFTPERISTARVVEGELLVPRGALARVRAMLGELALDDRTFASPAVHLGQPRVALRPEQARAARPLFAAGGGVLSAPTGSGKTNVALAVLARLQQRALVIVPTKDLVVQWCDRARDVLGIEAGTLADGRAELDRGLVIATPQGALACVVQLAARIGAVFVDECHHVPAQTYRDLLDALPARHRFGASATLSRSDGLEGMIADYLGPVVARIDLADVAAAGHVVVPRYERVATSFRFAYYGPPDWPDLLAALAEDAERNRFIVETVVARAHEAGGALVLVQRVQHAEDLAAQLRGRGIRASMLVGAMSSTQRKAALDGLRSGALQVLVGTALADEGLDVVNLARLFLAAPAKSAGKLAQRLGRIMRPSPDKGAPLVVDFVDVEVGVLRHQAGKREQAIRSLLASAGRAA